MTFSRYHEGRMQERSTVALPLALEEETAADWAVLGSHQELLQGLIRCRDQHGLGYVTCQFYNLPEDFDARLDWLERFGQEVIRKL